MEDIGNAWSLACTTSVPQNPDTGFKKCNRKWVEKVSGLWILLLCISFIIKCEYEWINRIWGPLPKIIKSEMRQIFRNGDSMMYLIFTYNRLSFDCFISIRLSYLWTEHYNPHFGIILSQMDIQNNLYSNMFLKTKEHNHVSYIACLDFHMITT